MATIPKVRERMAAMAIWLEEQGYPDKATELDELIQELYRRPAIRRAPVESKHLSEAMKVAIRAYKLAEPKASYKKIGNMFGVNTGRVSEAIRGRRI